MPFSFTIEKKDAHSQARAGLIQTPHGEIPTPAFAPVGTQATVKSISPQELQELKTPIIMANAYHLYLRPGPDAIARAGGLHSFMAWNGPVMTDSGGFQVFSLEHLRHIGDDGVAFRSHIDGSEHIFTPEKVIEIQEKLGADIIFCFDECPDPSNYDYNLQALKRTHHWAERCRRAQRRDDQALFGIVQGGVFADLRRESARFLASLDFPGYAIGGLSVGEPKETMHKVLEATIPLLPEGKPRHLLGVGSPEDLFECAARGIDTFDCVLPTRVARNGAFLTHQGRLNIRNARFAEDLAPIEADCPCYTCRTFSRAYLRHLIKAEEILGLHLATIHNLHFLLDLTRQIRQSILDGTFADFKKQFLADYKIIPHQVRQRNKELRLKRLREQA